MAPTARSPSPASPQNGGSPPPPLSKRDKRRTLIQDKLNDMLSSFNSNMRPQYDAQISAIYADLALISRADPYANAPLDTSGEGISRMVEELRARPQPAEGAEDDGSTEAFDYSVGRFYRAFAEDVNDALEARDIGIAQAVSRFEYTMQSLKTTHDHRILVAHEEHKLLSESIRSRLVQTLTTKRARLLREKEQLDISDSNSMLLHPAQFSIANPSSPGGPNHPRKTRHARHRIGDPDDPATQENKRKRKAVFDEDRDLGGSPGPSSKNIEFGNGSPFRDAKAKTVHHQYEAPAYSIDRLFSEKELALNMNTAQTAVRHFLIKLRTQENGANGQGDASADDSQDVTMGSARNSPVPGGDSTDETELPHPSTRAHLRGHVHGMSTRTLPTVALPPLVLPVPFTNTSKVPTAPPPQSLSNAEADEDLAIMQGSKSLSLDEKERILDHAIAAGRGWEASYWNPGDGSAADHMRETSRRLVLGMEGTQDALPGRILTIPPHLLATMDGRATPTSNPFMLGGIDAPAAGGGFGGVPMSRNGSAHAPPPPGGVGMRRTASGQPGDSSNGHGQGEGGGRSFLGRGRGRGRGRAAANNAD